MLRRSAVFSFPPNIAVVRERDVCVKRVALDRFHRVRIRFVTRARHDAEVAVLRIHRVQTSVANLHPGDVVADRRHFPAFEMRRRNQHREIGFAARTGERRRHVMLFSFGRFDAENQHVLGEPALLAREIRTDAQRETFLAQQNIAAVTGADRDDRVVLRKMTDEPPIRIHIEQRMHTTIPFHLWIIAQPFERDLPHARHDSHAEHDVF